MDTGRENRGRCKGPRGTSEGTGGREAANLPCIPCGPAPPLGMGHGYHVTFTYTVPGPQYPRRQVPFSVSLHRWRSHLPELTWLPGQSRNSKPGGQSGG